MLVAPEELICPLVSPGKLVFCGAPTAYDMFVPADTTVLLVMVTSPAESDARVMPDPATKLSSAWYVFVIPLVWNTDPVMLMVPVPKSVTVTLFCPTRFNSSWLAFATPLTCSARAVPPLPPLVPLTPPRD